MSSSIWFSLPKEEASRANNSENPFTIPRMTFISGPCLCNFLVNCSVSFCLRLRLGFLHQGMALYTLEQICLFRTYPSLAYWGGELRNLARRNFGQGKVGTHY